MTGAPNSMNPRIAIAGAIAVITVLSACGGRTPATPPPATTPPPSPTAACSAPLASSEVVAKGPARPKPASTDDRRTRRGRVYEELWKHEASAAARRLSPATVAPQATGEDIGQIAVIRDQ